MTPRPLLGRLMRRVHPSPAGCWVWPGALNADGYGSIRVGRRPEGTALVHRVVHEHLIGPIPADFDVDHTCGNRACCAPQHLEAVTHAENLRRARERALAAAA